MKRRDFVKTMTAAGTGLLLHSGSPFSLHAQQVPSDPAVRRVLAMFKCHFDAGFIDTQADVVHKYFNEYFPARHRDCSRRQRPGPAPLCLDHRFVAALRIP